MTRPTADIVIVGGGIMGLQIAHQISRRDPRKIVILEKAPNVGEGSTGASCAVLRQRYTHDEMMTVSRDSLRAHRNWGAYTGLDEPRAKFSHSGVLWMLGESLADVEPLLRRMLRLGIDAAILDGAAVNERFPALSLCGEPFDLTGEVEHECRDLDAFLYEADSGFFDPVSACQDLLDVVRAKGVEVRFNTAVTAIRTSGGKVDGVDLSDGTSIDAPVVINAAGPWAPRVAAMAGFDYKPWTIKPIRAQVIYREWDQTAVPGPLPVVGDASGGVYFRPEASGQNILVGSIREEDEREIVDDPDVFNNNIDAAFRDVKIHALHHRIPALPYRGQITGLAGMYTMNFDDVHSVVGPTDLEGFIVVNGFSGHGFKEAPAIGSMVARYLTGADADEWDTEVPIEFLSIKRKPISVAEKAVLA
jgi:glycine/D-amino acid oxidase-like deaminating enzyme